ncbi:UNVERIFIED_ORG: NADP-dependent 3-hydroxy acid dehydrogenase YdfG [Rhizobium pisi]
MIKRKGSRIINIGSQAGPVALRGEPIHCVSKAATSPIALSDADNRKATLHEGAKRQLHS